MGLGWEFGYLSALRLFSLVIPSAFQELEISHALVWMAKKVAIQHFSSLPYSWVFGAHYSVTVLAKKQRCMLPQRPTQWGMCITRIPLNDDTPIQ